MRLVFIGFSLILVLLFFGITKSVDDYPKPNMPPPSEDRKQVYEAYKLAYLPDGYPGKMTDQGLVAHPIYGPHVIRDFLRLYENGGGEIYELLEPVLLEWIIYLARWSLCTGRGTALVPRKMIITAH